MSEPLPESIGQAVMTDDGTLELRLRAETADGVFGDAFLVYDPDHPRYDEIKGHLEAAHGRLVAGEAVSVPPWPETADA